MTLFKLIRILILLIIFVFAAFYAKTQKLESRSWTEPLDVVIYPINGDNNSSVVNDYITDLDDSVFEPIDRFMSEQGEQYGLLISEPLKTRLGPEITELPPEAPNPSDGRAAIIWWGLKFRYWAFKNTPSSGNDMRRVDVFVLYHEAVKGRTLEHSLGLNKGLVAIVHAFASVGQEQQNNIVITHEFLHTVGATDKYDADNRPLYPDGYAEPDRSPLHPQTKAEIMAGRIPLSPYEMRMASGLNQCVIGEKTAKEIDWLQKQD